MLVAAEGENSHGWPLKLVVATSTPAISQANARFRPSSKRPSGVNVTRRPAWIQGAPTNYNQPGCNQNRQVIATHL